MQYNLPWRRDAINSLIEGAILKADERGVKVISLGLLNQVILNGDMHVINVCFIK